MRLLSACALAALSSIGVNAMALEVYGGVGSTGVEIGLAHQLADRFVARLEANSLDLSRRFTTSNIDYDAKLKFSNAGLYGDYFLAGNLRVTAGALIGDRGIHGVARSAGNTITLNGVAYPVSPGDSLDFDAKFPNTAGYLGIGWGHRQDDPGLHFYADGGVAIGRPKVTLSPSASLATKLDPADLASEQAAAQDKADQLRYFPVVKLGLRYAF